MNAKHSDPTLAEPLDSDELTELDAFLLGGGEASERLMIDEAHGLLTALAVARDERPVTEVVEEIVGTDGFADEFEQRRIEELIGRMRGDIESTLKRRQRFEPLVVEEVSPSGEVEEAYEGWCFGFMLGVTDGGTRWEGLPRHEEELLTPIATLALLHSSDQPPEMEFDEYMGWVEMIPGSVAGLYSYFGKRDKAA